MPTERKCENCIHFEVCCYVSHQLPPCDLYAEAPMRGEDIHAILSKFAEVISNEEPSQARYEKIALLQDLDREIKAASPTIEVEPVRHGRWISEKCNHKPCRIKNPEKWVTYKCSVCGYSNGRKQSNYCPNCGAKMDLEV